MVKLLFVCLGNICRSPMAEAVMRARMNSSEACLIQSRGTSGYERGKTPHTGTQQVLAEVGISTEGIYSEKIKSSDFADFDLIIGMDRQNVADLKQLCPSEYQAKIQLFLDVVPGKQAQDVPDPYYTGDFKETYQLVSEGCQAWEAYVKKHLE